MILLNQGYDNENLPKTYANPQQTPPNPPAGSPAVLNTTVPRHLPSPRQALAFIVINLATGRGLARTLRTRLSLLPHGKRLAMNAASRLDTLLPTLLSRSAPSQRGTVLPSTVSSVLTTVAKVTYEYLATSAERGCQKGTNHPYPGTYVVPTKTKIHAPQHFVQFRFPYFPSSSLFLSFRLFPSADYALSLSINYPYKYSCIHKL